MKWNFMIKTFDRIMRITSNYLQSKFHKFCLIWNKYFPEFINGYLPNTYMVSIFGKYVSNFENVAKIQLFWRIFSKIHQLCFWKFIKFLKTTQADGPNLVLGAKEYSKHFNFEVEQKTFLWLKINYCFDPIFSKMVSR